MASSAISIDTIRQSIGGFGVTAPGPGDGGEDDGTVSECHVKISDPSPESNILIGLAAGCELPPDSSHKGNVVIGNLSMSYLIPSSHQVSNNVTVGTFAIRDMSGGSGNVAVGYFTGDGGDERFVLNDCVMVGKGANVVTPSTPGVNRIAIGANTRVTSDDTIQLGANSKAMRLFCGNKEVAFKSDLSSDGIDPEEIHMIREDIQTIKQALHQLKEILNAGGVPMDGFTPPE